jgi:nucleotide-binding universal stress UspA family protein
MNRGWAPDEIRVGAGLDHRLVVGFDGSLSAASTVEWAAREAVARTVSLCVVACFAAASTVDDPGVSARNRRQIADAIGTIRRRHPELCIEDATMHVGPHDRLLEADSSTDLLIIGGSSPGTVRCLLLGLVPRTGARRSSCPVIVVRGRPRAHLRRIVVGIDSSNAAAAALDWAIAEAECHGSELLLVHAWRRPCAGTSRRRADLDRVDAQCVVDLAIRHCQKRTSVHVCGELIEGEAAAVLTAASSQADLLAVGSRGRSGFKTMLFGSVALFVAGHACCPVAVIHPHVRSE